MFDAICVPQRTRKPWTVTVSIAGQMIAVGLAVLIPLVGTDALPRRFNVIGLPEPPRPPVHHAATRAQPRAHFVPTQFTPHGLMLPRAIPDRPVILIDPDSVPDVGRNAGIEGGIGSSNGTGSGVIDSLIAANAAPPPPPLRGVAKPAPAAAPPRIKLGGVVVKSKFISGPAPEYPTLAKAARIEGLVRLEAVIGRDGRIMNLRAISGHPMLIPAALAAVERWIFQPTLLNGDPVEVDTEIEVNFTLRK